MPRNLKIYSPKNIATKPPVISAGPKGSVVYELSSFILFRKVNALIAAALKVVTIKIILPDFV